MIRKYYKYIGALFMHYTLPFIVMTLIFNTLQANEFETLNLPLTQEMKKNQSSATICDNPAVAQKKLPEKFRYGCFCGKDYPNIKLSTQTSYKKLNTIQKESLIAQYYKIKPYDTIDKVCMLHDICYISKGKDVQTCNDALYNNLTDIKKAFRKKSRHKSKKSKERRCKNLSSDMASLFKTIFTAGDDTPLPRIGAFIFNTPMTLSSKLIHTSKYPRKGEPCILDN